MLMNDELEGCGRKWPRIFLRPTGNSSADTPDDYEKV
jgi:hypothetical protein